MESESVISRDLGVLEGIKNFGAQSLRKLAFAIGLSKDKVYRSLQAVSKRNLYPESGQWETEVGYNWLRILLFAVLLEFGIKGNQGADRISDFFKRIRLDRRLGVSPTTIRNLLKRVEKEVVRYQQVQESEVGGEVREIIASGDETFFNDQMILVLMDLGSGYIVEEEAADDRTYETWKSKADSRLSKLNLKVRHFVSDRAKALIKLALSGFGCQSGADIFHAQYDISKWLGMGFYRYLGNINKRLKETKIVLENLKAKQVDSWLIQEKEQQLAVEEEELEKLNKGQQAYSKAQQNVSKAVHPFSLDDNSSQDSAEVERCVEDEAEHFEEIAQTQSIDDDKGALDKFRRQIKDIASIVDVWWLWATESLITYGLNKEKQDWLLYTLLPVIYWYQQMRKTKHPELKKIYKKAWKKAFRDWENHALTKKASDIEIQEWLSWGEWITSQFQRASSPVEGRNGYLSQMHHSGRGLTVQRLRTLTVIHNFDSRRRDGKTAAERLFNVKFPDLFDWLINEMGELPLPRSGRQCRVYNPLICKTVAP